MPILHSYVDGIERQIQESKNEYASRAQVVEEIEIPEENLYQVVTMIDGLDDATYSFEAIFDDYFPQLQRRQRLEDRRRRRAGSLCDGPKSIFLHEGG